MNFHRPSLNHACVCGACMCAWFCGCVWAHVWMRIWTQKTDVKSRSPYSASHSWMQDLSIKPTIAFMVNLDRQCALKSPASTPEGSITGLPPYPHSIYLGWGVSKYPSFHPPSIQQALNHWALSQTHIDLIFKNSFHTFLFCFLTVSLLFKESLCYLIIFDSYDFLILLKNKLAHKWEKIRPPLRPEVHFVVLGKHVSYIHNEFHNL